MVEIVSTQVRRATQMKNDANSGEKWYLLRMRNVETQVRSGGNLDEKFW